jgi:hypothetical protein
MKRKDRCAKSRTLRGCDKKGTNRITKKWITGHIVSDNLYCDEHYQEQLDWSEDTMNDIEFQFRSPDLFRM